MLAIDLGTCNFRDRISTYCISVCMRIGLLYNNVSHYCQHHSIVNIPYIWKYYKSYIWSLWWMVVTALDFITYKLHIMPNNLYILIIYTYTLNVNTLSGTSEFKQVVLFQLKRKFTTQATVESMPQHPCCFIALFDHSAVQHVLHRYLVLWQNSQSDKPISMSLMPSLLLTVILITMSKLSIYGNVIKQIC